MVDSGPVLDRGDDVVPLVLGGSFTRFAADRGAHGVLLLSEFSYGYARRSGGWMGFDYAEKVSGRRFLCAKSYFCIPQE